MAPDRIRQRRSDTARPRTFTWDSGLTDASSSGKLTSSLAATAEAPEARRSSKLFEAGTRRTSLGFPRNWTLTRGSKPPERGGRTAAASLVFFPGGSSFVCSFTPSPPKTNTLRRPAKRISRMVRDPSGFKLYTTVFRSYRTWRSVQRPAVR